MLHQFGLHLLQLIIGFCIGVPLTILGILIYRRIKDFLVLRNVRKRIREIENVDLFDIVKGLKKLDEFSPFVSSLEGLIAKNSPLEYDTEHYEKTLCSDQNEFLNLRITTIGIERNVQFVLENKEDNTDRGKTFDRLDIKRRAIMYYLLRKACAEQLFDDHLNIPSGTVRLLVKIANEK